MRSLRHLLAALPLPPAFPLPVPGDGDVYAMPAAHLLGAELPQGHLHVWSGPPGAGKTAFLLGLLLEAARRGRGTCLATYDLPAASIALRLLAMESGVPLAELEALASAPPGAAVRAGGERAVALGRARARLETLPIHVLEARGLPVASLDDRCVRCVRRIDVLGVDFVEAVHRPAGTSPADTLHHLGALAKQRWMAVVAIARTSPLDAEHPTVTADRVGWLHATPDSGSGEASVLRNRHGATPTCRLHLDPASARWLAAPPGKATPPPPGGA